MDLFMKGVVIFESLFLILGTVAVVSFIYERFKAEELDPIVEILMLCGAIFIPLHFDKGVGDFGTWWPVLLGVVFYTVILAYLFRDTDKELSALKDALKDALSKKVNFVDWQCLRRRLKDLKENEVDKIKDELERVREDLDDVKDASDNTIRYGALKEVREEISELKKRLKKEREMHGESDAAKMERQGQEAELRNLRDEIEKLKEEMAFLRATEERVYDRTTANQQNRMTQAEGDKGLPDGWNEVNVGLIPLRRIQRDVDDEA